VWARCVALAASDADGEGTCTDGRAIAHDTHAGHLATEPDGHHVLDAALRQQRTEYHRARDIARVPAEWRDRRFEAARLREGQHRHHDVDLEDFAALPAGRDERFAIDRDASR